MSPEYILHLQVLFLPPQNLLTYHESNKAKSVSKMRLFLNLLHFSYLNDSIREHQSQHHNRMRHSHQSFWKGFPQPHAAANLRDVTAISSFQPYCFLKQWQLSPGTPWILLSQPQREWSITNIWSNEPCKKGGRAAVDVSGGQEGDRQRDHFANLQASFVFFIPIFYLHHDFPSIVSPGYYGAFMFSFPPTPSVHFMFVFVDLGMGSTAHLSYNWASMAWLWRHQGCCITHKRGKYAWRLSPLLTVCAALIPVWAKLKG